MSDVVRVRYAPSPTGYQHMGNLRTALFNWLFARHMGGAFLIRIEDTDRERSKEEYVDAILDDFRWLGLEWDEGVGVGGPYGPYKQSERLDLYREYAEGLVSAGKAYPCYCTSEELDARRKAATESGAQQAYDGRCRSLTVADRARLDAEGRVPSVRFRVPPGQKIAFNDMVLGETSFDSDLIGDFVIMKSDGFPTYHFGVVIDDLLMKITHVIRADGHLSNTPLHCLLFDGLGAPRPTFAHLPSVLSADGKGKLSKRLGALSMIEYRKQGYLPEALVNYMALLGWSPGDDREFMTRDELIRDFSLDRVKKSGARFDQEKLSWMNAKYIKQCPAERLAALAADALRDAGVDVASLAPAWIAKLAEVYRESLNAMSELPAQTKFFFVDAVTFDPKDAEKFLNADGVAVLRDVVAGLAALSEWNEPAMEPVLKRVSEERKIGFGKVAQPIRVAITGTKVSKGIFETLALIGRERSLARMTRAIETFGK